MTTIRIAPTCEGWQAAARELLRDGVPPSEITWREDAASPAPAPAPGGIRVPRQFLDLARRAAGGADPERWTTLYAVLYRLVHERRDLLGDPRDPDVRRLRELAAQAWRRTRVASSSATPPRWCSVAARSTRAWSWSASMHPSAVLRGQDDAEQARLHATLLADLCLLAAAA